MKKIFLFAIVGLMSLLGGLLLSSCDDKSTYMETGEFAPECYLIKDESHISVIGTRDLVIEEAEKTDWDIYVPFKNILASNSPLEVVDTLIFIFSNRSPTEEVEIPTSAGTFTVAVSGLTYNYTYMGEQLRLICNSPLAIRAEVQEDISKRENNPFHEEGKIILTLESEAFTLIRKEIPFEVYDDSIIN